MDSIVIKSQDGKMVCTRKHLSVPPHASVQKELGSGKVISLRHRWTQCPIGESINAYCLKHHEDGENEPCEETKKVMHELGFHVKDLRASIVLVGLDEDCDDQTEYPVPTSISLTQSQIANFKKMVRQIRQREKMKKKHKQQPKVVKCTNFKEQLQSYQQIFGSF